VAKRTALSLLAFLTACAGTQIPPGQISSPGEALFNGQVRADIDCYRCHNGDASGTWRAPNLTKRVAQLSDGEIAGAIATGPGMMPSYQGKLSAAEVAQITAWLRSRAGAPAGQSR
jgi:mono/diheme cytochrome c family protein